MNNTAPFLSIVSREGFHRRRVWWYAACARYARGYQTNPPRWIPVPSDDTEARTA